MDPVAAMKPDLELRGLTKRFGHVTALEDVSFEAFPGQILAIVGDNGAGKSTIIRAISGVHEQDAGDILVRRELTSFANPAAARAAGIATVFQDLALVECLDVSTNMFLGQFPRKGPFVDRRRMDLESRKFLDDLKVTVADVRTPIGLLSGGQRQIIAIARAVRSGARTILLDEPTAALGVRETRHAGEIILTLREQGKSVICVSHDLEFVFGHADRILVMRLGRVAGVRSVTDTNRDEIVHLITGTLQGAA